MELYPAIDIKGGQVVRLTQGDYNRVEVYDADPASVAARFMKAGAKNLHMVDLDGAKEGTTVNEDAVKKIAGQGGLFLQLGGGIRTEERVERYLSIGIHRVILGTAALERFDFLERMVKQYGEKIAVGVDARDGKVAVRGWLEVSDTLALPFCKRLEAAGVSTIIYTDISRDGMGEGANLEAYEELSRQTTCQIIASGGVTRLEELSALKKAGVHGVIVGKALYNGALKLEEVLAAC